MIEQYLPNNNETATVAFRQKFCQLNRPYVWPHQLSSGRQYLEIGLVNMPLLGERRTYLAIYWIQEILEFISSFHRTTTQLSSFLAQKIGITLLRKMGFAFR
jgi:hypothetical protein